MTSHLRRTLALAAFGIAVALSHSVSAAISLVGIDITDSDANGTATDPGYRYSSNSNDFSFADELTLGASSQAKPISFTLATGANTFTFSPTSGVDGTGPGDTGTYTGFVFFFNDTGTSFNPTTSGNSPDLAAYVQSGTSAFAIPAANTLVEDYVPNGGGVAYSGATSFSLDGQTVTLTALTSDSTPAGTFTLTVTPEPASLSILMIGGIGLLRRRRPNINPPRRTVA
jgi:hypothetical protein